MLHNLVKIVRGEIVEALAWECSAHLPTAIGTWNSGVTEGCWRRRRPENLAKSAQATPVPLPVPSSSAPAPSDMKYPALREGESILDGARWLALPTDKAVPSVTPDRQTPWWERATKCYLPGMKGVGLDQGEPARHKV